MSLGFLCLFASETNNNPLESRIAALDVAGGSANPTGSQVGFVSRALLAANAAAPWATGLRLERHNADRLIDIWISREVKRCLANIHKLGP